MLQESILKTGTVALIHYGDGSCDNIATKIICENGECYNEDGFQLQ